VIYIQFTTRSMCIFGSQVCHHLKETPIIHSFLSFMRIEVFTVVSMKMVVFWVLVPCSFIGQCQHFRETYSFHLQDWKWRACIGLEWARLSQYSVLLWTGRPGNQGSITSTDEDFPLTSVHTGSGTHPASYTMGTGGPFPRGKAQPGHDADHRPPT
jgi:hypothetical protein